MGVFYSSLQCHRQDSKIRNESLFEFRDRKTRCKRYFGARMGIADRSHELRSE